MTQTLVESIDTRFGTYNSHSYSNGNTLPLTGYPFGMNYFAPQTTDQNGNWWFNPYEPIYQGIRLTHQPSPWLGDFSSLLLTPITGSLQHSSLFHRQSSYDLEDAIFRPDLLEIYSHRYQIRTRLTPSLYGANLIMTSYHKNVSLVLFVPEKASYKKLSPTEFCISIYSPSHTQALDFCMYLYFRFNAPIQTLSQLIDDQAQELTEELTGTKCHLQLDFDTTELHCQFASSFISIEQAQLNALRQGSFQDSLLQTTEKWNSLLNRVEIQDSQQKKEFNLFYHCLYRCLLFPQTFFEVTENGDPVHFDTHNHKETIGKFFTNNGYWDTFRSNYPLLSLLYPEYLEEFLEGILQHFKNTNFLPKWLSPDERNIMPGTLVDGVIADACCKGISPQLMPELLEAMLRTSQQNDPHKIYGRKGNQDYKTYGFLPSNHTESVSHSLDYAYSDWCISQVAKHLQQTDLSQEYAQKSLQYRQLFDKKTGFIRAKNKVGHFQEPFILDAWGRDYAECSAIQASLSVFHDIEGLVELMGGKEKFTDYLIQLCNTSPTYSPHHYGYEIHEMSEMAQAKFGQLAISNQPSFHIPYLFHWSNKPEYTSLLIKLLLENTFKNGFQAFPGDEDNGSLSAWYIFSSMGFYPVCPGKPTYHLGIPSFKKIILHLPNHTPVTISAKNLSTYTLFVQSAILDGLEIDKLNHHELLAASHLEFTLSLLPKHKGQK